MLDKCSPNERRLTLLLVSKSRFQVVKLECAWIRFIRGCTILRYVLSYRDCALKHCGMRALLPLRVKHFGIIYALVQETLIYSVVVHYNNWAAHSYVKLGMVGGHCDVLEKQFSISPSF